MYLAKPQSHASRKHARAGKQAKARKKRGVQEREEVSRSKKMNENIRASEQGRSEPRGSLEGAAPSQPGEKKARKKTGKGGGGIRTKKPASGIDIRKPHKKKKTTPLSHGFGGSLPWPKGASLKSNP